jgi:hypothetical protein
LDFQELLDLQEDVFFEERIEFMVYVQELVQLHVGQRFAEYRPLAGQKEAFGDAVPGAYQGDDTVV